jgi:hypothetical protein
LNTRASLVNKIKAVNADSFNDVAKELFLFQKENTPIYNSFCSHFDTRQFPIFLPISAFKNHQVVLNDGLLDFYFESSGTTASINSKHYIQDFEFYLSNAQNIFQSQYGSLSQYCILALLPHYLERKNSSLIAMVDHFIKCSVNTDSGFYLNDLDNLMLKLEECKKKNIKTILFGVSFALMDFAEKYDVSFPELIIMETGGMKGRRPEITKEEMHQILSESFGTSAIHSEYGMTELLSQAYSQGDGLFNCGQTMSVIITEINDPFAVCPFGKAGVINVLDLANIDTCAFIATEDIGIAYEDGRFRVLGRLDQSDIRGCNLLISDL